MAYPRKLPNAARRHYNDATSLLEARRYANAGYHFGLAAECALKAALIALGERKLDREGEGRSYWAHFPELKAAASTVLAGRISQRVVEILKRPSFMQNWHIKMRYSGDTSVTKAQCEMWQKQAIELVTACLATV